MGSSLRFGGTMRSWIERDINPSGCGIIKAVLKYYPDFTPEDFDASSQAGVRPCSPDGLPTWTHGAYSNCPRHRPRDDGPSLGPVTGKLYRNPLDENPSIGIQLPARSFRLACRGLARICFMRSWKCD